jgi:hypothetical protein
MLTTSSTDNTDDTSRRIRREIDENRQRNPSYQRRRWGDEQVKVTRSSDLRLRGRPRAPQTTPKKPSYRGEGAEMGNERGDGMRKRIGAANVALLVTCRSDGVNGTRSRWFRVGANLRTCAQSGAIATEPESECSVGHRASQAPFSSWDGSLRVHKLYTHLTHSPSAHRRREQQPTHVIRHCK